MAIQQYDYTACCTGFLQQLPSFWGIQQKRTTLGPFHRSGALSWDGAGSGAGRWGGGERWGRKRTVGPRFAGPSSSPCTCGLHNISVRKKERKEDDGKKKRKEKKERNGERGLFLVGIQLYPRLQHCRNSKNTPLLLQLRCSREAKLAPFSDRYRALNGGQGPFSFALFFPFSFPSRYLSVSFLSLYPRCQFLFLFPLPRRFSPDGTPRVRALGRDFYLFPFIRAIESSILGHYRRGDGGMVASVGQQGRNGLFLFYSSRMICKGLIGQCDLLEGRSGWE